MEKPNNISGSWGLMIAIYGIEAIKAIEFIESTKPIEYGMLILLRLLNLLNLIYNLQQKYCNRIVQITKNMILNI